MTEATSARKQRSYSEFPGCKLCKAKLPIENLTLISEPDKGDYLYCRDCCKQKFGTGRYQKHRRKP